MNKLLVFLLLLANLTQAQSIDFKKNNFPNDREGLSLAIENFEKGDELFNQGPAYYKLALEPYLLANAFNPNNSFLNFKIGKCYLHSSTKQKAISYLEKAKELNVNIDEQLSYYLGWAYHLDMQWDKAIEQYKKFGTIAGSGAAFIDLQTKAKHNIKSCETGKVLQEKPIRVFVDNAGAEINSKYSDYGPVISADESVMLFTSRREGTTGGGIDQNINEYMEDIYISQKVNGKWSRAQNIGAPVNTVDHDANSGLSADGQKFLIYNGNGHGDLLEASLIGDKWDAPKSLGKSINSNAHESSACYSPDGKSIYFVSDNPETTMGDRDIFMSRKEENGKWGKPVNLGPTINTSLGEEGVFIHPDGKTMYFSSEGHSTMGGYDIFKSVYENGKWGTPENLGFPVNTPDNDVFFVISASGKHGYYSSFSDKGYGEKDIFLITFLGPEKPMVLNNEDNLLASITAPVKETVLAPVLAIKEAQLTILKGIVSDALSKKPLDATIEIIDNAQNISIATFTSNSSTGKYLVSLPAGKNYGIAVKKVGYLFQSENFDIPAAAAFQQVVKDIFLKGVDVGSTIVLKNIFFDLGKATLRSESTNELERLGKLLYDNPTIKIEISGHTDNKGSADLNKKLSDGRAKAVVDYLISKGITGDRLTYVGYGKEQPIASNDTEEGRQQNRRTEFKIISK
jgi:outer membrane protein OmpA-like peptidoglycan-associated protein/tetratricopeptide (TPR) repeat protein